MYIIKEYFVKSKDLIRRLQELDPSGEIEVCIGNEDIWFLQRLPAYYDGPLQVVTREENDRPLSMKYTNQGDKIDIRRYDPQYFYEYNEDFPVDFSDLHDSAIQYHQDMHERYKREWKESEEDTNLFFFIEWVRKTTRQPGLTDRATQFHKEHYKKWMQNPPDENPEKGLSPLEQWEKFWMDRVLFEVNLDTHEYSFKDSSIE
jgi:hypothetical protein